ncbi:hypothetical protein [[Actinomadura] parvosata]|nr:hypothetical protein [Nonomuraea sp. ATCC 55076]
MDVDTAETSARQAVHGTSTYATAVARLRADLAAAGPVGAEGSDLAAAIEEFTGLLLDTADRTAQAYGSTAEGMSASVTAARSADSRATAPATALTPVPVSWV